MRFKLKAGKLCIKVILKFQVLLRFYSSYGDSKCIEVWVYANLFVKTFLSQKSTFVSAFVCFQNLQFRAFLTYVWFLLGICDKTNKINKSKGRQSRVQELKNGHSFFFVTFAFILKKVGGSLFTTI